MKLTKLFAALSSMIGMKTSSVEPKIQAPRLEAPPKVKLHNNPRVHKKPYPVHSMATSRTLIKFRVERAMKRTAR